MENDNNSVYLGDVLIYFNMAGILIVIIYSIFERRRLVRMEIDLDKEEVTPSDYGVIVRNVGLETTQEELKRTIEQKYTMFKTNVVYINYCYNIDDMVECNKKMADLLREKSLFKIHYRREMKARGITREQLKTDPTLIKPPTIRTGIFKSKTLNV